MTIRLKHFGFFFGIASSLLFPFILLSTVTVLDQGSYGIRVELPQEIRRKGLVWFLISSNRQTRPPGEQFNKKKKTKTQKQDKNTVTPSASDLLVSQRLSEAKVVSARFI